MHAEDEDKQDEQQENAQEDEEDREDQEDQEEDEEDEEEQGQQHVRYLLVLHRPPERCIVCHVPKRQWKDSERSMDGSGKDSGQPRTVGARTPVG